MGLACLAAHMTLPFGGANPESRQGVRKEGPAKKGPEIDPGSDRFFAEQIDFPLLVIEFGFSEGQKNTDSTALFEVFFYFHVSTYSLIGNTDWVFKKLKIQRQYSTFGGFRFSIFPHW